MAKNKVCQEKKKIVCVHCICAATLGPSVAGMYLIRVKLTSSKQSSEDSYS